MTRKRRNDSSSGSEKSHPSNFHRSISPSTFHRQRVHRLNNLRISDEKRNRQNDKGRRERGNNSMDWRHCKSRNDDNDVPGRVSNYKTRRNGKEMVQSQKRVEKSRASSSRHDSQRKVEKKFGNQTDRKLSTSNAKEERLESVIRDHPGQLQDAFNEYLRGDHDRKEEPKIEKEKPNFEPSGKLAEDTNTYRGVVIKYNEPSDAHIPKLRWRLYPFKGDEALPVLYIHRQSAYLIGRDRKIADLPVDHPSCSKQHAVFQYRLTPKDLPDGTTVKRIRPYIIDLDSANGTYLNNERIESQRFIELREKDVLRFGFSTREFVLLNERSHDEEDVETVKKEELSPS
ncbi:FHA domain-containing protein [Loa loa]|uniref:FHA domain-containing protein n=2 Tax=Loa loa TaxID=7209 RepID=A0A1S0U5E8_LOALO|nr:FHA domain-containing protein [Loa loa]EFO24628.1 FHA domain-containing protein [Loa loa]